MAKYERAATIIITRYQSGEITAEERDRAMDKLVDMLLQEVDK